MDQAQASGFIVRIQNPGKRNQLIRIDRLGDLHPDRIHDAAEILDMRAIENSRTFSNPGHVGRQVVPSIPARDLAGLRRLVFKMESLVTAVEINPADLAVARAHDALDKSYRITQGVHHPLVFLEQVLIANKIEPPVLGVVEIRKAAGGKRPYEIHRHRRALVSPEHSLRIGNPVALGKVQMIDHVSTIGRQGLIAPGLKVARARLGVLSGEASHTDDFFLAAKKQHEAHLEKDLEFVGDIVRLALIKIFSAVASLQHEGLPAARLGRVILQPLYLPTGNQRRQPSQLPHDLSQGFRIRVVRHLNDRFFPPGIRGPGFIHDFYTFRKTGSYLPALGRYRQSIYDSNKRRDINSNPAPSGFLKPSGPVKLCHL